MPVNIDVLPGDTINLPGGARLLVLEDDSAPPPEQPLRFTYPTTYLPATITSPYGPRGNIFHYGIDLRSSWRYWQSEAVAAIDGEVILAGLEPGRAYFGQQVQLSAVIQGQVVIVRYAHLAQPNGIYVTVGQQVTRGQLLGRPNNTGVSYGDHLHFDVRVDGAFVNPTDMIDWPAAPLVVSAHLPERVVATQHYTETQELT